MENENISITMLKGPDRVRKRPGVIFGCDGAEGCVAAVKCLLELFTNEAATGHSSGIDVVIHKDNSVSIRSFDRGLILDETVVDGKPLWYQQFCELYCGPRNMEDGYYFSFNTPHSNLYGETESGYHVYSYNNFLLCAVQYASAFMHVEATRDGIKKTLDFEKGFSISDMHKEKTTDAPNTFFHFQPDPEVFGETLVPASAIGSALQEIAVTIPGIKCEIYDERNGERCIYHYPLGAQDYLSEITKTDIPLYIKEIEASGKDRYNKREYNARVKLFISFTENVPKTECFHNHRLLQYGGHHLKAVEERIIKYVNWHFKPDFRNESEGEFQEDISKKAEITTKELSRSIVLLIVSDCTEGATNYENATKKAITNKMIADMAADLINEDFRYYLKQNHDSILAILKKLNRA